MHVCAYIFNLKVAYKGGDVKQTIMTKKVNKKSNNMVGKKNENLNQEAKMLLEKGVTFGDAIISMLSLFATDWKGMGVAAIGLAKALASLKDAARRTNVNIEDMYECELAYYLDQFEEMPDENEE